MKRTLCFLIFGLTFVLVSNGQENGETDFETVFLDDCLGKTIELTLPKNYAKTSRFDFDDGFTQNYIYLKGGGGLTVVCREKTDSLKTIYTLKDTFWRQETIDGILIFYTNVSAERKKAFDKTFDKMID